MKRYMQCATRNILFNLLLVLGLVLALGGTILMAHRAQAQGPSPQGPRPELRPEFGEGPVEGMLIPQSPLGTAFTYQGRVVFDGTPVDGTCDFEFGLWTDLSGGSQVGGQAADGVVVNDGYFSVSLDFSDVFAGETRYLEIGVNCGGGSALLEPRVTLTAAPYALYARSIPLDGSGSALTAARSDHDHWGQVWGGSGTALALNSSGGGATLSVSNATHDGLLVVSAGDDGLEVSSANYGVYVNSATYDAFTVNNAGDDGLDIYDAGSAPTHTLPVDFWPYENTHDGIDIAGAKDYGLWVGYAGEDGVYVGSAGHYGVQVASAGGIGVYASAANDGVYVSGGDDGVHVSYASDDGIYIEYAGGDGIELGIAGGYGLNMPSDGILVNGCTGCTLMFVAQNGDGRDLEPGDVVVISGVGQPFASSPDPTFLVRRADEASSPAVAGVVYGSITAVEETRDSTVPDSQAESTTHLRALPPEEAPAGPGEYLVIVTMGMARVKVDASAGSIHPGDLLTASASGGQAMKAQPVKISGAEFYPPGTIIGKAMEPLEQGSGLVWVMVTLQ